MNQEIPEYALNTGWIYDQMKLKWQDLPRKLFFEVELALQTILFSEKLIAVEWDGNHEYFNSKFKILEKKQDKILENQNFPPFSQYFLLPFNDGFNLYNYSVNYHILKSSYSDYYKLFFVINLLIIDKLKAINFLIFQLNENFNSDNKNFNLFLELINLEYEEILPPNLIDKLIVLLNRMAEDMKSVADPESDGELEELRKNKAESTYFQTLAMYYILQELKVVEERTMQAKVRLIRMLINKNETVIRKTLENPFDKRGSKSVKSELERLKGYFEKLKMNTIVELIEKDIRSIE